MATEADDTDVQTMNETENYELPGRRSDLTSDSAIPLVWPPLLELPAADKLVVYLDLNHWIGLSQALIGHRQGAAHVDTLEACRAARASGRVTFVLSGTAYIEVQRIKHPDQRRRLAEVVEELADFSTLVGRHVAMALELDAVLDPIAKRPSQLSKVPLLGRGVRHAFGIQSGFSIMGPEGDVTESFRQRYGPAKFDAHMAETMLKMERSIFRGPMNADEEKGLRSYGYLPESTVAMAQKRLEHELSYKRTMDADPSIRRGDLTDYVSVRELLIEFQDILPRTLQQRGLVLADLREGREAGRRLVHSMPSTDVSITLKSAWHRNGQREWATNDIFDIDALSLAMPYCDVVVTEKACAHILRTAKIDQRMNTALLTNLQELPEVLKSSMSKRVPATLVM
ncbi:MAG: hypothetical protein PW792_08590 [Acidobacteriaceae bacterium]|nr:hypothetical protein [Acidobacteriaceae bacterium]